MKLLNTGASPWGWSFWGSALTCPRKWALDRLTDILAPLPLSEPLVRGSAIHLALGHWRLARLEPGAYYPPAQAIDALIADREAAARPYDELVMWKEWGKKAIALVPAYERAYPHRRGTLDYGLLEVESLSEIDVPATDDGQDAVLDEVWGALKHTTRKDWTAKDTGGGVWIADIKTFGGRWSTTTAEQYIGSGQMYGLHWHGVQKYGKQFAGVMLDFVGVDGSTRRFPLPANWNPRGIQRWPQMIRDSAATIARLALADRPIQAWPGAERADVCISKWGVCPAFVNCHGRLPVPGMMTRTARAR